MNAAVKTIKSDFLTSSFSWLSLFDRKNFLLITLCITIIISALSIIYVTNETRGLYATIQHQHAVRDQLYAERGKLLLEQGTFASQTRIERVATDALGMTLPATSTVIMM